MALEPGVRLGPYEVLAAIGEGGMGKVYRARDTRLKREVALKVLPDALTTDPDRLARFQREAEVLASLNHPNIAQIYGLERQEAREGRTEGAPVLVMELVEGATLSELIEKARGSRLSAVGQSPPAGPQSTDHSLQPTRGLPLDDALAIARQIADALEAAHEHGIVHRDLKPVNIKVRDDGTVKVLDFGLAKALQDPTTSRPQDLADLNALAASPTLTSPVMTQQGVLLGTAAYMSPEQARGKPVDRRTDIWAFGCVLYEMLTGRRAFPGEDVGETMAAVIRAEPDWSALPADTPAPIRRLLHRSLQKDPKKRLADAADARLELEDAPPDPPSEAGPDRPISAGGVQRRQVVLIGGLAALAGAALAASILWPATTAPPPAVSRFVVPLPPDETLLDGLALSPDGRTIVYRAQGAGVSKLFRRSLGDLDSVAIEGTDNAEAPFFAPDGRWLGFWADGTLRRVALSGGPPIEIGLTSRPVGASWGTDGTILFGAIGPTLFRIDADGGRPEPVLELDFRKAGDRAVLWPRHLPDGRGVVITLSKGPGIEHKRLAVLPQGTTEWRELVPGSAAQYVPSGHLLFVREAGMLAAPFDLDRLEITGAAVPIVPDVGGYLGTGSADFDVSATGHLVYTPRHGGSELLQPVLVTRQGQEERLAAPAGPYRSVRLSPDGASAAFHTLEAGGDILIWHVERRVLDRATLFSGQDVSPAWSPDSRRVFHGSRRDGPFEVYSAAVDGTGEPRLELANDPALATRRELLPMAVSPDGRWLVVQENFVGMERLRIVPIGDDAGPRSERAIDAPSANDRHGVVSPDGRFIAFESDQLAPGRPPGEIFVRTFPDVDAGRWLVSRGGGHTPVWGPDGRELFYVSGNTVMRVPLTVSSQGLTPGAPERLFAGDYFFGNYLTYDIAPDGRRFVMLKPVVPAAATTEGDRLVVVLNWLEELKAHAPVR